VLDVGDVFAVVVASADGRVLDANRVMQRMLGYASFEAILGEKLSPGILKGEGAWDEWADVVLGGGSRAIEVEFSSAKGGSLNLRGALERVVLANREAAVRAVLVEAPMQRRLHELAQSAARMSGALRLAAGVAHDFNNLLAVLVGNLYLVADGVRGDPALYDKVRRAREAGKRGAVLARQILESARGMSMQSDPQPQSVVRVAEALSPLFATVLGTRVRLKTSLDPQAPPVVADRAELEGVITNLVINARDAVAEREGGTVKLSVGRHEASAAREVTSLPSGTYVEISVSDNGCGIPEELIDRVVEPFFTTKPAGQGSGLGLSMVQAFARRAGGCMSLRSQAGKGTVVSVLLPAADVDTPDTTVTTIPLRSLPSGRETVVILSDDGDFRATVGQLLESLGYRSVRGSPRAVQTVALNADAPAIVVTDTHTLTDATVSQVCTFARSHGAHRIVAVGETNLDWRYPLVRVAKPFTLMEFARAVRGAVDGGRS
jgi:signal transduction histidine kinase